MGARGPLTAQPHRELAGRAPADGAVPPAPRGVLAVTRRRWRLLWESPLAGLLADVHLPALHRLFRYYDEWERVEREYRERAADGERVVTGSKGQERMHPLADRLLALEERILRLEDKLGLNPMAAARLGIAMNVQQLTWQAVAGRVPEAVGSAQVIDVAELPP